jgi:hypothetical protein
MTAVRLIRRESRYRLAMGLNVSEAERWKSGHKS